MIEDRFVEQVLQPGMVVAVQVAVMQHSVAGFTMHIQMLFQRDFSLGECAGLVGAQHVHRPEVLDGVQAFDDHFLPGHG